MVKKETLENNKIKLNYDGELSLAVGKTRFEKQWKNQRVKWSNLVAKLRNPVRTRETYQEYKTKKKVEQDQIKDIGGFVGGVLKEGKRTSGSVLSRQLLTLDLDYAPIDFWETQELLANYACCIYSTHKHSKETPRFRILVPLDREVSPEEYEAIARKLAQELGMDYFDDTTYQPSRLMYWPSVSADGDYIYNYLDLPFLKADEILSRYIDWRDTNLWPESSRMVGIRKKQADKQGDPSMKQGLIGAFCRTYSIEEAIEKFLPTIYVKCNTPNRYTYADGSTAGGLVLYESGKFAYSNHGTDPCSGKLCNSFDLVRIHRFGALDVGAAGEGAKLPSYKAMMSMIQQDPETAKLIVLEGQQQAKEDFQEEEENHWMEKMILNKQGAIENNLNNAILILQNDPNLRGIVFNELADGLEKKLSVPWKSKSVYWRDADNAQLEAYLSRVYTEFSKQKLETAIVKVSDDRGYHPVKDYLENLPKWDEIKRVDTLLIDYLGAEDNLYTRTVTRKTLCAAIQRVSMPGCKFDTMLVLNGPQGVGKSTFPRKIGMGWYTDALHLNDTKDKTAAEKLQGNWIVEIGELAGMRKMDVETLKSFISRQDDKYRASYGRMVTPHPRQCIFIGTTNAEDGFLRDITGGRRFWPVRTPGGGKKKMWDLTRTQVDQIWAEVKQYVEQGEVLYLDANLEQMAQREQKAAMESDDREGLVREYLDALLPEGWGDMNIYERRAFLYGDEFGQTKKVGTIKRQQVCNQEIWCECFKKPEASMERKDSYAISGIMEKIEGWSKWKTRKRVKPYGQQRVYERVK